MKKSLKRNLVVLLAFCFLWSNSLLMIKAEEEKDVNFQEETQAEVNVETLEKNKETPSIGNILINKDNFPDSNFLNAIKKMFPGTDVITAAQIANITSIGVSKRNISNLKGIEHFTALVYLDCGVNQLTTLDVSKNTKLKILYCDENQLTNLHVSENKELIRLVCSMNQLPSLDVSENKELISLVCCVNQLSSINISNNTKLKELVCFKNQFKSLDVSKNTSLTYLDCGINKLPSLDVSNNIKLESLLCDNNQLTSLDISKNLALTKFRCENNKLMYLNVLADLDEFSAQEQINSIAIKAEEDMYDLMNFGVGMDVAKISNLQGATLEGTKLKGLEIGKNVSYTYACGNGDTIDVVLEIKEKTESPVTPTSPNIKTPAPNTGDTTNTRVLFVMMGAAVLILGVLFVRKRMEK